MEEFRNRLAKEFSHAADLYRHVAALLEQSDPGLSQVCRVLLAEPPGFKSQPDEIANDAVGREPHHVIHLMHWWASYGDFESVLMTATPTTGKTGFLSSFSKDKSVSKAKLEHARTEVYGDQRSHPLNWYVNYKENKLPNSGPTGILCCDGVVQALIAHSMGDWRTLDDVKVDFFDAVTRSVALRQILLTDSSEGLTLDSLHSYAKELGLTSDIESFAKEDKAFKEPVRPVSWTHHESAARVARPKMRVSNRILQRTGFLARPKSWLQFASHSQYQADHKVGHLDKLIALANSSWPSSDDFANEILGFLDNPSELLRGVRAMKAVAGFLVLAAQPTASDQLDGTPHHHQPRSFVQELQSSLNLATSPAKVVEVRVPLDLSIRRIPSRTANSKDGIACQLKLDGKPFALIGKLRRSEAPPEIFASVFLYELHAWAVDEVAKKPRHPGVTALLAALKQAGCCGSKWEETKKTLLSLTPEAPAEAITQAFSALWPHVLAFRDVAAKGRGIAEPLFDEVDHLLKDMVHATLQVLEKRGGTIFPPRFRSRETAGEIDLKQWLAENRWWQDSHSVEIEVRSGTRAQLAETSVSTRLQMQLPGFDEHNPHDVRLLNMPGVFFWPGGAPPVYVRLIHHHICRPIVAAFTEGSAGLVDFGTALTSLRQEFSSGDGAKAFDDLIKSAGRGDTNASRWVDCLKEEPRFQFACFPRIENCEGLWIPSAPVDDDEGVKWDYDDHTPHKALIRVTYALNKTDAVAVFSKGRRNKFRELAAADDVHAWCERVCREVTTRRDYLLQRSSELLRETEQYWAFRKPIGTAIELVAQLLDQIGEAGTIGKTGDPSEGEKLRDDGYMALRAWLNAIGGEVTPDNWSAREGSEPPAEYRDKLPRAFSSSVPMGRTIVNRFGVKSGAYEKHFDGALSAGAPFQGFKEIDDMSRQFWKASPDWDEQAVQWSTVPGITDDNQRARVLYKIYKRLAKKGNDSSPSWLNDAKERIITVLSNVFGWKPFPGADEAELGPGQNRLAVTDVEFDDGRKAVSGTVSVIVKGFKQGSDMRQRALVVRK